MSELGQAEGVEVETPEPIAPAVPETPEQTDPAAAAAEEDPAAVAARNKQLQKQRERERIETERAERLKAERKYFENKPFGQIVREYSRNPFWALLRLIRHLLVIWFGIIPKDTDRPDYKERRQLIELERDLKRKEKQERGAMEVYYKKYGQTTKYRLMRAVSDWKFRRKREKQRRSQPRPVYTPPQMTPEQMQALQREMRALYKKYHVSIFEKMRRHAEALRRRYTDWKNDIDEEDRALNRRVTGWIVGILLGKVVSVFFIAIFWKPYFLFSCGLKKSVTVYWRGMAPYYIVFACFTLMTLAVYYYVLVPEVTTLPRLLLYGAAIYLLLMVCFFLTLFYATKGMKYFVARKPAIYCHLATNRQKHKKHLFFCIVFI
jgi:hypothetical protein